MEDLNNGEKISILVAPANRTVGKLGHHERLLAWLKQIGVNCIYDVSLGADICTWAHVKNIKNELKYGRITPLITQPCPPIVNYILKHNHALIENLSPIQSPMLCTAIYMKNYVGVTDKLAAISPCIAKKNEFEETGQISYNVTLKKLYEYIETNKIKLPELSDLPDDFNAFDHDEDAFLGRIYSAPGGLRENVEFYLKHTHYKSDYDFGELLIDGAEGVNCVYDALDVYSKTPKINLPTIFDVLNCKNGCNLGTGCTNTKNRFEVKKIIHDQKQMVLKKLSNISDEMKAQHLTEMFAKYDKELKIDDFVRQYKPLHIEQPDINENDIERAFISLGKTTEADRIFDCEACGCDTCYEMARKVAAGIDLPQNCMQKEKYDAHEKRRENAEESQAKTRFLTRMSHEIRTPMNAILGITELQLQRTSHPPETEEALFRIYDSSKLLLTIINDILDLSKVEAGKMELVNARYRMASFIVDTVQLNIIYKGSKNIEFKISVDEILPEYLIGDETRIKQVLNNFLSNAFKYTDEGSVSLSIKTADINDKRNIEILAKKANKPNKLLESDELWIVFSVQDTGQGMTTKQSESLFDREFARFNLKANKTIQGSGLGMSIAYQLITLMGGYVTVESRVDEGSLFTIYLPQKSAGQTLIGNEESLSLQNLENTQNYVRKKSGFEREPMPYARVLVVDDVESNLYVAKGLLLSYKIVAETAESGFEAIEKVKSGNEYDIIFMDHMMPEMDGIETVKIIRKLGYPHPIVALTANTIKGVSDMFAQNGFNGFVSKPIDPVQLNSYLMKFIQSKQSPEFLSRVRARYAMLEEDILSPDSQSAPDAYVAPAENFTYNFSESLAAKINASFLIDAEKFFDVLGEIIIRKPWNADDMTTFRIFVHGMKSALNNIDEPSLAALASDLENLGKKGDIDSIKKIETKLPTFLSGMHKVVERIRKKIGAPV